MTSWSLLIGAGLVEVVMALALKQSEAWTRLLPSVVGLAAAALSIVLLTLALKGIRVSTGYAVWTGIGAVGVVLVGTFALREPLTPSRLLCIGMVVAGTIGLRALENA